MLFLLLLLADRVNPDLTSLIAAEKAFAAQSEQRGMKAAFLANLAEDAVLFRPRPVPGRAWTAEQPEPPGTLAWRPSFAAVARTGDLGYTTGPYEFRLQDKTNHGHFVSLWARDQGGRWKVVLDAGTPHPRPEKPLPDASDRTAEPTATPRNGNTVDMEQGLPREAAAPEWAALLGERAGEHVRTYRTGQQPTLGREALAQALKARRGRTHYDQAGSRVSAARDLGYCYGSASLRPYGGREIVARWCYLRIWSRGPQGWELVLDLESPIPPEKKP